MIEAPATPPGKQRQCGAALLRRGGHHEADPAGNEQPPGDGGAGFEIVSEGAPISPYHLLAASLSSCTVLTLQSWAEGAWIDLAPLITHLTWERADERPAQIARLVIELRWPGLPEDRVRTAERVADLCPIHATLTRGTQIERRVLALPLGG